MDNTLDGCYDGLNFSNLKMEIWLVGGEQNCRIIFFRNSMRLVNDKELREKKIYDIIILMHVFKKVGKI